MDNDSEDLYLRRMKGSRNRASVLKLRLVTLRSALPQGLIFVFEGDDDKIVYSQWIKRLEPQLHYEPFPCSGKSYVLHLKQIIERDKNNLKKDIYFFIDRDFDDFAGLVPDSSIFMTQHYSVENYLVERGVLDELLKNEFHCHGDPALRARICDLFESVYDIFLALTKETNRLIYVARQLGIEIIGSLTDQVAHLAEIAIDRVLPGTKQPWEIVVFGSEPNPEQMAAAGVQFEKLEPKSRYRGKFAYAFFLKWLRLLCDEFRSENSIVFQVRREGKVRQAELVMSNFASKCEMPSDLDEFVKRIPIVATSALVPQT